MKHTECKDCELSKGDCGYHFKMGGKTNYDIASLSACDKYGNCEFFKSKAKPQGDLISRNALIQHAYSAIVDGVEKDIIDLSDVDNAPTALFPLTVQIIDKVTDEDIENIKQLMKAYKPQILNLKTEKPQGEFVEMLNERIEKRVCKYCQMNKHCELCEISRVFSIIALTDKEMKDGAENG